MYYVSEETFESLDEETQKRVLADDKKYKAEMGEEPEREDEDKRVGDLMKDMTDEEKNETKSFDDAHDKGLSLIIAMGRPKKKEKSEQELKEE